MAEKLREIIARCDALARELEKPEIYSDAAAYARIAKELKELEPVAAAARDYFAALERAGEAETLFDDPSSARWPARSTPRPRPRPSASSPG